MGDRGMGGGSSDGKLNAFGPAREAIPSSATGVLVVDLGAIAQNYCLLRQKAYPAECAAVVKADAYGLRAQHVVPVLLAEGCGVFFVATLGEAREVRSLAPDTTIYVLDGLLPETMEQFVELGAQPVLGSAAEIAEWTAFCRAHSTPLPAAIHIDTGMNRLGLSPAECHALSDDTFDTFLVSLLMSHLACADEPDHGKNTAQLAAFQKLSGRFPPIRRSLANSAGIFLGPEYAFDLARPGIALYGGNPYASQPNPMEPVIRLYGRIAQIGEAQAGETVGYGAGKTLTRPTRYITVTTGYADGYFRSLGSTDDRDGARAFIDGHVLPILGRVSMDLIVFDATDMPAGKLMRGGFAELIGPHFTLDEAAACAGTIGYELLTSLGKRYHRIYTGWEPTPSGAPLTPGEADHG